MGRPPEFERAVAVQQAVELFSRQGYTATSVQELGAALGLKPGSLYNAFGDKHSLFLEALDCYTGREQAAACSFFAGQLAGKVAIEAFFQAVVEADMRDPDRRGCLMLNSAAELASRDLEVRARAEQNQARMEELFRNALAQGQRAGEIGPQADLGMLAAFLVNSLYGLRMMAKMQVSREALLAVVKHTLATLS